jgi:hypothetical protein
MAPCCIAGIWLGTWRGDLRIARRSGWLEALMRPESEMFIKPRPATPPEVRAYYRRLGGHVHCRFFMTANPAVAGFACGDLTFRVGEFEGVRTLLSAITWIEEERGDAD